MLPVPVEGARMSELEEQNADRGTLPRSLNGPNPHSNAASKAATSMMPYPWHHIGTQPS